MLVKCTISTELILGRNLALLVYSLVQTPFCSILGTYCTLQLSNAAKAAAENCPQFPGFCIPSDCIWWLCTSEKHLNLLLRRSPSRNSESILELCLKGKQPQITVQFEFLISSISRRLQPTGRTAVQLQANTVRMHTGTRFYVMKRKGKNLTATEFFISATAEVNSLKWSSGQYTRGWTKSPQFLPALTQAFSHSSLLVRTAAWYFPVAIPW